MDDSSDTDWEIKLLIISIFSMYTYQGVCMKNIYFIYFCNMGTYV